MLLMVRLAADCIQPRPVSRCLSARLCRLHRRDPLLHLPREVRRDAEHPLNHHQLPAVMHLVFLGRRSAFRTAISPAAPSLPGTRPAHPKRPPGRLPEPWRTFLVCGAIVFITAGAVFEFCGDEEWPTAVFLSLLAVYSFSVYWRYMNQREEFTEDDYFFHVEHKP